MTTSGETIRRTLQISLVQTPRRTLEAIQRTPFGKFQKQFLGNAETLRELREEIQQNYGRAYRIKFRRNSKRNVGKIIKKISAEVVVEIKATISEIIPGIPLAIVHKLWNAKIGH